jgi:hypothetical protein
MAGCRTLEVGEAVLRRPVRAVDRCGDDGARGDKKRRAPRHKFFAADTNASVFLGSLFPTCVIRIFFRRRSQCIMSVRSRDWLVAVRNNYSPRDVAVSSLAG